MAVRLSLVAALVAGLAIRGEAPASALPPPPSNPSDQQLNDSKSQAAAINAQIGALSAQVAQTQTQIDQLRKDMELKAELSLKASVDLDLAETDAAEAAAAAEQAAATADAAEADIASARNKADNFAAASFRQGSTLGSMSALMDSGSIDELIQRKQLLQSISDQQLDAIGGLQRAQVAKSNLDAAARQALLDAQAKQAAADAAKVTADKAAADAATAAQVGEAQLQTLQATLTEQQVQHQAAVNTVNTLQSQRKAYNDWLVLKKAEEERLRKEAEERARKAAEAEAARKAAAKKAAEEAAARRAAEAIRLASERASARQAADAATRQALRNAASDRGATDEGSPVGSNSSIGAAVVASARQWLGTQYAWGGGNSRGPSQGIRDGGVADAYGDYMKVGFDCSGLTLYAYAQVGISLPHYSGYQYFSGPHISRSNLSAGDLLFWAYNTSDPDTIHHVAIWVGDGTVIEAPNSGSYVKISSMDWDGYIGASRPYAR